MRPETIKLLEENMGESSLSLVLAMFWVCACFVFLFFVFVYLFLIWQQKPKQGKQE